MPKGRTVTLDDVEILRVGTWNGYPITRRWLQDLVDDFGKASQHLRPTVRLGHDARQAFARALFGSDEAAEDPKGWPALGEISAVELRGDSLYATLSNVPAKLADWVKDRRWLQRSAGVWFNRTLGGRLYAGVLDHVALLGSDTPEVDGLEAIGLSADPAAMGDQGEGFAILTFGAGESGSEGDTDLERLIAKLRAAFDEGSPLIFGRKGAPRARHAFGLFASELRRVARADLPQKEAHMSTVVKVAELLNLSKDAEPAKIAAGLKDASAEKLGKLVQFMAAGGVTFDTPEQLVGYLAGMLGVAPGDLGGIAARIAEAVGATTEPADPAADPNAEGADGAVMNTGGQPVKTGKEGAGGQSANLSREQQLTAELATLSARQADLEKQVKLSAARERVARDQADRGIQLPAPAVDVLVELAASGQDQAYKAVLENTKSVPTGEAGTAKGGDAASEPTELELSVAKRLGYSADDLREFRASSDA